jgi:hypothetical protein
VRRQARDAMYVSVHMQCLPLGAMVIWVLLHCAECRSTVALIMVLVMVLHIDLLRCSSLLRHDHGVKVMMFGMRKGALCECKSCVY